MEDFKRLADYAKPEQTKLKWLLLERNETGIVESGVAVKFGREWFVNEKKLPEFLTQHTLATLKRKSAAR